MTQEEREAKIAELKKIPKPVQYAALLAFALGFVTLIRVPLAAYASHLSVGKAIFYGFLMLFWFFTCGASLYTRGRWGYVGLVAISLLPFLGLLGFSLRLLRFTLQGTLSASWPETVHCLMALVQLVLTLLLFWFLLRKQVRDFVWGTVAVP